MSMLLPMMVATSSIVLAQDQQSATDKFTIFDAPRDREIPVLVYLPASGKNCSSASPCPVALLSSGYGIQYSQYSFIANALTQKGYLVAAIQHELPDDPPLSIDLPYLVTRAPNWSRGVENLRIALQHLQSQYPNYGWNKLLLVGHSNGGDIAALFSRDNAATVTRLVTLDNRRMPLPRNHTTRVLSIRASDFPADADVLPGVDEQKIYGIEIVMIAGARHNDMYDGGNAELKNQIISLIDSFID